MGQCLGLHGTALQATRNSATGCTGEVQQAIDPISWLYRGSATGYRSDFKILIRLSQQSGDFAARIPLFNHNTFLSPDTGCVPFPQRMNESQREKEKKKRRKERGEQKRRAKRERETEREGYRETERDGERKRERQRETERERDGERERQLSLIHI